MFGLFKKKQALPSDLFLALDEEEYSRKVRQIIDDLPQSGHVMVLVAYQNLEPLIRATSEMSKSDRSIPGDIDGLIRFIDPEASKAETEIGKRRKQWFWIAALIKRLDEKRTDDSKGIWDTLIDSGAHIHTVLPNNEIWNEDEKAYFSHIKGEKDGTFYVSNILNPHKQKWS